MTRPTGIATALEAGLGIAVHGVRAVAGGDINEAFRADTAAGPLFVKTRPGAAPGAFAEEAADLAWLAEPRGLPVPAVRLATDDLLALDWIDRGPASPASDEALGRGLAAVHAAGAGQFGAPHPFRMGALELPNDAAPDFATFFADCRLRPMARLARDAGTLSAADAELLERVAARLPELAGPPEPPARTHGDLWSGNVLVDAAGRPHLIDPAAHGAHREVDLATLRVFGGPSPRCFAAYDEAFPLVDGHADRVGLWQLGIVLLHVVLFGSGYAGQALGLARRYA